MHTQCCSWLPFHPSTPNIIVPIAYVSAALVHWLFRGNTLLHMALLHRPKSLSQYCLLDPHIP